MRTTHISIGLLVLYAIYLVRLICILPFFLKQRQDDSPLRLNSKRKGQLKVFVFLGSGGHTGEMLRLLENYSDLLLANSNTLFVGYSDTQSRAAFAQLAKKTDLKCRIEFYEFIKAREVNSSYFSSFVTIVRTLVDSCFKALSISLRFYSSPHLVLLNGPGTCCVLALWFKLFEWVNLFQSRSNIVYVESLARITSLSLSGKLLYWLADSFVVQWKELQIAKPRAEYYGILV